MNNAKGNNLDMENAKSHLEKFIQTKEIEKLRDINDVVIDRSLPVMERIISFIQQIGDPYFFKVGDTPVRVKFTKNANTFQESVEHLISNSR